MSPSSPTPDPEPESPVVEPDSPVVEPVETVETPHDPAGLDLARAAARAAAAVPGVPARTPRRRGRPGASSSGAPGSAQDGGPAGGWFRRSRRGQPQLSGPRPDGRDPQPVGFELDRIVRHRGWERDLRVHAVFGRWAELVGTEIADHCTPESFVDGRVVARTDSTAWATQLRLLAPTLVRRLNEELGHGTVSAIDVLGPHGPTWKKGLRSVRDGRGPRDTYG